MKFYIIGLLGFFICLPFETVAIKVLEIAQPIVEVDSSYDTAFVEQHEEIALFDFDTYVIEQHEGCTDSLVYPGGGSGPTISCGLDIGNAGSKTVSAVFEGILPDSTIAKLMPAVYVRGERSKSWITSNQVHIGKHVSVLLCNRIKKIYWRAMLEKYPNLVNAPPEVKTAVLDLGIQVGNTSKRLNGLSKAIADSNWHQVATVISNSCSDFRGGRYHSIHLRRVSQGTAIKLGLAKPRVEIDYD